MKTALTVPLFPSVDRHVVDGQRGRGIVVGDRAEAAVVRERRVDGAREVDGEGLVGLVEGVAGDGTTIVRAVSPARKVSVPLAAVKSAGDVAVPPLVA